MRAYDQLRPYMEKAMTIKTALTLFEWDNETLAPDEAGELTASVIGVLSGEYLEAAAGKDVERLLAQCEEEDREDGSLAETERAVIREMREERAGYSQGGVSGICQAYGPIRRCLGEG